VDYLTAVAVVAPTPGGADREADTPYLDRLSDELELSAPRPILPRDFAVLARRFGAYRATAIDGYRPSDGTSGHTATITLAMADEVGNALPGLELTAITTALAAMREVGWAIYTLNPTHSIIDVTYAATAYPDTDPVAVKAAADAKLATYLSGAAWGAREDTGETREWLNEPTVRYLELAEQLQRVEGLRFVDSLTFAIHGNVLGTANVVMPGVAPLPTAGTIPGTVAAG
jgi:hypothetical protein